MLKFFSIIYPTLVINKRLEFKVLNQLVMYHNYRATTETVNTLPRKVNGAVIIKAVLGQEF